jgi:hypothetical protein
MFDKEMSMPQFQLAKAIDASVVDTEFTGADRYLDGALSRVIDRLAQSGAGLYTTHHGTSGGQCERERGGT